MIRVESLPDDPAFCRLDGVPGVAHDLRYSGTNNFAGRVLYRGIDCAWLRREAADALALSAAWLAHEHPGHTLLVLDALRPQRVQEAIWAEVAGTEAQHYFAEPTLGSIHSYGLAVDVTLRDAAGQELDMGAGFDEMTERSHPALEAAHLAQGVLTTTHLANRQRLYRAMAAGGFQGISTEWWHFNLGEPAELRRKYSRVY